jgi:hypothetical protein
MDKLNYSKFSEREPKKPNKKPKKPKPRQWPKPQHDNGTAYKKHDPKKDRGFKKKGYTYID